MAKDNVSLVKSIYDAFNNKSFDQLLELGDSQTQWLEVPFRMTLSGQTAVREAWKGWADIFPDGNVEVKSIYSAGDCVIAECIGRGAHQGVFRTPEGDLKPTGNKVEIPFCDIIRLKDGKVLSAHSYFDFYMFLKQLGQQPRLGQAA